MDIEKWEAKSKEVCVKGAFLNVCMLMEMISGEDKTEEESGEGMLADVIMKGNWVPYTS